MTDTIKALTDAELIAYLHIGDMPNAQKIIDNLTPEMRATYDRMAQVEHELALWNAGLGPKPAGILIDRNRKAFR